MLLKPALLLLAFLAAALAQAPAPAPAGEQAAHTGNRTLTTAPFTTLTLCAPLNVRVATGPAHRVTADSADPVPLEAVVGDDGGLTISATDAFAATAPVKILVEAPADGLAGVSTTAAAGAVVVDGAFTTEGAFNISTASAADFVARNVTAAAVNVAAGGEGRTIVGGAWPTASVAAGGVAEVWLLGGANKTSVVLSESATLLVSPDADAHVVDGLALSTGPTVVFDGGRCFVPSPPFGGACVYVPKIVPPRARAAWTCGLETSGPFACPTAGPPQNAPAAAAAATAAAPAPAGGVPARRRLAQGCMRGGACAGAGAGAGRRTGRGPPDAAGPVVVVNGRSAARLVRCSAREQELNMMVEK